MRRLQRPDPSIARLLVSHCTPLLAGMKVAHMLTCERTVYCKIAHLVCGTGIQIRPLTRNSDRITFFLYDELALARHVNSHLNAEFLRLHGYEDLSLPHVFREVSRRYASYKNGTASFPHELGVLLGYPLHDVIGFMEHGGKNCLFCGYWKVYSQPEQKAYLFRSFDRAREHFLSSLQRGNGIRDILAERHARMYAHCY